MNSTIKSTLFATAALAQLAAPAGAQGPDAAKLNELTRIIEQQQKMIEAQAKTLEALKTQVEALKTTTQANKAAATDTSRSIAGSVTTAPRTTTSFSPLVSAPFRSLTPGARNCTRLSATTN